MKSIDDLNYERGGVTRPEAIAYAREMEQRIREALDIAVQYGQIDGAHHKAWTIDQMVRKLTGGGDLYTEFVAEAKAGEDGPDTYSWDEGIAP